jgi:HAD superfamily hydrolase (TIGR01484 family)
MKYKAIFLDLDGTAVPIGSSNPSPRVVEAITKAHKKVNVCIATGRPLDISKPVIRKLHVTSLCSVHDATQIYDPIKDVVVDTVSLSHELADQAIHIIKRYNFPKIYVEAGTKVSLYKGEVWPEDLSDVAVADIPESVADDLISKLSNISEIAIHKNVSFTKGLFWVSVVNARATKLHAIVRLAELLGIYTKEIIGVGDSYNDFPLLEACGLKIAMGNAVPELKAIADFIAPSVEDDGVATVINKFILNK